MNDETQRIDKFLANNGICARRAVEKLLIDKIVTVNGKRATEAGLRIHPQDKVVVNGIEVQKPELVYFLLNKPKGYISTTSDERSRNDIVSLVKTTQRIYPVGRLDRQTSGLIILTNDGELTNHLTHPRYNSNKTYQLIIKGVASDTQLDKLRNGVDLEDGLTYPAKVDVIKENDEESLLHITIHEGRNRQIRRMCEAIGIKLLELSRIAIGDLKDESLRIGKYRELTSYEIEELKK